MCVVSMIADHYEDKFRREYWEKIFQPSGFPLTGSNPFSDPIPDSQEPITDPLPSISENVTREEFEQLKKEVQEMKELLRKAKQYDERTNQPHCEKEEKIQLLRKIAELVGVDLNDVL